MNRYFCACALLLSACATAPDSQTEYEAIAAASDIAIPAAWQVDMAGPGADSFAALFDDPQLTDYLALAEAQNFDLAQSRAILEASQARLEQAQARQLPSLSLSGNAGASGILGDLDGTSESVGLSLTGRYDPDLFGGLRLATRSAALNAEIDRAELARLRRVVLDRTVSAYVRAIEAAQLLAVAEQNLDFLTETLRVSRARYEAGDTDYSNLALSELEAENARSAVTEQRFAAEETRRALSILTGGFGDASLTIAPNLPRVVQAPSGADRPAETLAARADVQAARLGVYAAVVSLDAAKVDDLPSFDLNGGLRSGGFGLDDLFDVDGYIASLGSSLLYNLFDGGLNDARQDEARARIDGATARYGQILRTALREGNSRAAEIAALSRSIASLDRAQVAAERALELEQIRFDLGEAILLDVLTVQRRVDATRSARIRAQRRYLEAVSAAHLAFGA